ncbi:LacI family DNA-binding transcriptional regulator [uncultured Cetobacterium sp.]|uniref:LacI family DNA-binding transcriptional regulator n=2 Tax=Cetobacterium sp. TaxID=2071632 RepID=UPI0025EB5EF5|nr:LacI family DNA-binding transcriptional regulator [uncultured Cetobacterium sp.]
MKKKLTIKEIAELSGVGKSTVSRFFNDGYVSESVREKIEKVILEYNYEPNLFARGIKARNNRFVGVIVPCLDSTITSTILMQLDNRLRELGYVPLIINTNHDITLELANLENLSRLNVEGIVLVATEVRDEHKEFVKKSKIPVLFVGQICDETYSIANDEIEAGKVIGNYIGESGHKDILYIGVDEKDILVGAVRKNTVISELEKYSSKIEVLESDFSFDKTERLVVEYLKNRKPTCIICATDNMAFGAIKALNSLKIKIPEEISVVGFGGYKVSDLIVPSLTTIRFFNELTGELAADSIVKLIMNEKIEKLQKIGFQFLERKSVAKI